MPTAMIDAPPSADPDDEPRRRPSLVIVLLLVGVLVVAGVAVYVLLGGDDGPSTVTASGTPTDSFDRQAPEAGLGETDDGHEWDSIRGRWGISRGRARTFDPTPYDTPSLTVMDRDDPDGAVGVTMAVVKPGNGLVYRFEDEDNYLAVLPVPARGEWILRRVIDGRVDDARTTGPGLPTDGGTEVEVRLDGPWTEFWFDGRRRLSRYERVLVDATQAGLLGSDIAAPAARWDDFYAVPGR